MRALWAWGLGIAAAGLAAGCGGKVASARPWTPAAPAAWEAGSPDARGVEDRWWTQFSNPALEGAVEEALRANLDMAKALARMEASAEAARIAGAALAPSAGLSFDSQRQQQNFVGLPIPGAGNQVLTSRATTHRVGFNVSWELDVWGRLRAGRRAALKDYRAAEVDYRAARQSLAGRVVKAWAMRAEAGEQLSLARATAKNYALVAEQSRRRYERGLRSALDLRLAQGAEASARALEAQRANEWQQAARAFEILLGRYPKGEEGADGEMPLVAGEAPAGLPSELLGRRPDLLAAEAKWEASRHRVKEAKAAMLPRISLSASGGRSSNELEDLLSNNFNVWTLAGNLAQPLFEGGKLRANARMNEARAREAAAEYGAVALRAFREVEAGLAGERWTAERVAGLEVAARESELARALAEERHARGLENFVTVLEAQRRALESASQLLAARRAQVENRVDLHLALGGGFGEAK